LKHRGFSKFL